MYDLEYFPPQSVGEAGDVLIVDDNRLNLAAIEAALTGTFVNVVQAQSGDAALRLLLDRDFALILLDVQMPSMNGFETASLIRQRRRSRHTPIIFVTAHDSAVQEVLRAYELGAVDFLYKPLVPEILRAKAEAFVHLRWQRLEVERQADLLQEHERREHEQRLKDERRQWEEEALRRQMVDERKAALELSRKAEELAQTVEELERVKTELEDNDKRKTEFIAVLAHELRNPLAPIVTGLELARPYAEASGEAMQLKAWQIIERQTAQLTRLVDDLLDVSRINSGKIELRKTNAKLSELMDQAVATSRPALARAEHELVMKRPAEDVTLYVDPVRIVQALSNLLNNAARYTPSPGNIRFTGHVSDATVTISVEDNGRGLSPEALQTVFDMFVQERQGGGGLGIGLTLVKRLVELHDGSVVAHSLGAGLGATFTVTIPLERQEEMVPEKSNLTPESSTPMRIVLVEDNADIREMMRALLEMWGHDVKEADTGPRGVELILSTRPSLALVDVGLPELDGCGVAKRVRETLAPSDLRLIAMTGYGQESDRARVRDAGFDAHLVKPVGASELREVLAATEKAHS